MSANDRSAGSRRSPECDALAPLLALRETGLLDAEEAARVERHLASCSVCPRDVALDGALAGHLRRALLPRVPAAPALGALSMEEIMRAANEPGTTSAISDAPEAPATAERPVIRQRSAVSRWGGGLSAIAAVLALVTFAAYIFGSVANLPADRDIVVMPNPTVSPLPAQQTVYVPTDAGIYALRASDGALRWTYPAGIDKTGADGLQAILGLALDHGVLYVLNRGDIVLQQASLTALNASDGAVRWSETIPVKMPGSLLQVGDLLIVTSLATPPPWPPERDWTVEAFSAANGYLVWRHPLDEPPIASPVSANSEVYIGTGSHVVALSAATGAPKWSSPILPSSYQQGASPVGVNTFVALAASGNVVYALAKRVNPLDDSAVEANYYALAAADGGHLWRTSNEHDPFIKAFAPAVAGDASFVPFDGGLSAFSNSATPAAPLWRFVPRESSTGNDVMTGAAVSDGVAYVTDFSPDRSGIYTSHDEASSSVNFTYAVRAADGVELWRAPTNVGYGPSTPVVISGLVIVPSIGVVRALRASDGRQLWMHEVFAGGGRTSPLIG